MGNFKVYNASAGSGKTFTLVKEFLKLMLHKDASGQYFRSILAMTFTNKAASEMKDRILDALQELGFPDQKPVSAVTEVILPELIRSTAKDEAGLREAAKLSFTNILHHYDDFPIGTIDSFVHKIIRQFAGDLQLASNFDVELDTVSLIEQVIDLLISEIGEDEEITNIVLGFLNDKDKEGKSMNVEYDLKKFAKIFLREDTLKNARELNSLSIREFDQVFNRIYNYRKAYQKKVVSLAQDALSIMRVSNLDPLQDFARKKSGIGAYFVRIADGNFKKITPNTYVLKAINEDSWYTAKTNPEIKASIDGIKEDIIHIYQAIIADYQQYVEFGLLSRYAYPMRLLNVIYRIMEDFKDEQNLLAISDFNTIIHEVVKKSDVPFIYEKIGAHYQHFLIDEFQDTSVLQWQNLLPLVHNSLSENNFNMIVGDGKQAIYRWRGGEVQQFVCLPEIFKKSYPLQDEYERMLMHSFESQHLMHNRRSRKTIVEFNKGLFDYLKNLLNDDFQSIYSGLNEEKASRDEEGYVAIRFLQDDDDKEEAYLNEVKQIINENVSRFKFQYRDIAVLCRRNEEVATVGKYLMENGIEVLSNESLLLNSSFEVRFIVSLAYLLIQTDSDIRSAEVLYFAYKLGLIHKEINALFGNTSKDIESYFEKWFGGMEEAKKILQHPLYEIFELLIRKIFAKNQYNRYLLFFMENVLSYSMKKKDDLPAFLEWWETKKDSLSIVVPEGIDAVRILTIHKAKGLQFPIVIYPFASGNIRLDSYVWIENYDHPLTRPLKHFLVSPQKEMEGTRFEDIYTTEKNQSLLDLLNVLYVALTRPQDKLYVISEIPKRKSLENIAFFLIEYLKSIDKWNDEQKEYTFGIDFENTLQVTYEKSDNLFGKQWISEEWNDNIIIKRESYAEHSPQLEYGRLMHDFLSGIDSVDAIQKNVNRFVNRGIIANNEREIWEKRLFDIVSHPKLSKFFDPALTTFSERSLFYQGKMFRPDRIVIDQDRLYVLDFKTGEKSEKHKRQVNTYASLFYEMGYENISSILVYLGEEIEILEV